MPAPLPPADQRFPDAETIAVCERFSLWLRQGGGLNIRGRPRPSADLGGTDFVGFDEYSPGMDLRHVDWSIYARNRGLYVRRFADEGAGLLVVVLDASGSMGVGEPPKWPLARQLAAVLVFAALRELHQVLVAVVHEGRLLVLPPTGGLSFAPAAFRFLGERAPAGPTDLAGVLGDLPVAGTRGDAVVISDFLDPRGPETGLDTLRRQGFRVDLLRLAAPGEFQLPPGGAAVFDPEGPGHRPVPAEAAARAALQAKIEAFRAELATAAARHGSLLLDVQSDARLPVVLERYFRAVTAARGRP